VKCESDPLRAQTDLSRRPASSPLAVLGKRLGPLPIINAVLLCGCVWAGLRFAPNPTGFVGILVAVLFPLYAAVTCVLVAAYIAAKDELGVKRRSDRRHY